jgi:hypothetical protein
LPRPPRLRSGQVAVVKFYFSYNSIQVAMLPTQKSEAPNFSSIIVIISYYISLSLLLLNSQLLAGLNRK